MGSVFSLKDNDQYPAGEKIGLAQKAVPAGDFSGGSINVIEQFPWTYTRLTSKAIQEVPYIDLTEYYLLDPYINQLFRAYGMGNNQIGVGGLATEALIEQFASGRINADSKILYQGLYDHVNPSGFSYRFPYFNATYLNTQNAWTATPMFNEIVALTKKVIGIAGGGTGAIAGGALAGAAGVLARRFGPVVAQFVGQSVGGLVQGLASMGSAGVQKLIDYTTFLEKLNVGASSPVASIDDPAIDKPHIWNNTAPYTYLVSFPLFNTLDYEPASPTKWNQQITRNWELCHLLCYQNLYNKRNLFTGIPPVFYSVNIPGVYYTKAAYVSDLTILNAGNIRTMSLPVGPGGANTTVNVPDAYVIVMTLTDFFQPSKNFMATVETNDRGVTDDPWNDNLANPVTTNNSMDSYRDAAIRAQSPLEPLPPGIPGVTDRPAAPPVVAPPDMFGG